MCAKGYFVNELKVYFYMQLRKAKILIRINKPPFTNVHKLHCNLSDQLAQLYFGKNTLEQHMQCMLHILIFLFVSVRSKKFYALNLSHTKMG